MPGREIAKLSKSAAECSRDRSEVAADLIHTHSRAVVAVAIVGMRTSLGRRETSWARHRVNAKPCSSADSRAACRQAFADASAVEQAEKARRRPLVRERDRGIPRAARRVGLRQRTRKAAGPVRGEVLHRVETERSESIAAADLMQPVGAGPEQCLEPMATSTRVPDRFVRAFDVPARIFVGEEGCAAECDAGDVVHAGCVGRAEKD